uniref:FAD/NAD(P)-binding protein n=1 Tax=Pararhizobium sp. IMCC3301 TaxID=3067904 RepID=UPI00274031DF|nr:FAD/NAD(P)-binding protein [Pararhizobium sp. IMCC3301]
MASSLFRDGGMRARQTETGYEMADHLKLCVIGSGAMGIYLVNRLVADRIPASIEVFEATDEAGTGMPYRQGTNADYMLCNAFSREIPPITRPLIDWLESRPPRELSEWELSTHDLSPRAFYPRTLIGEYLSSEFDALCCKAKNAGFDLIINTCCNVTDISVNGGQARVTYAKDGEEAHKQFDIVIIATGHKWPAVPTIDDVQLVSPWPYSNIEALPDANIGVLGSSLSAIDAVIALGHAHGHFDDHSDHITWHPNSAESGLRVTMVSRTGVMPEGDFYYPFPYEPLQHLTEDAVAAEIAKGKDGLLQRTFALLCAELDASDPSYLKHLGKAARTLEGFAPGYFSHRQEIGGLAAVKDDLAETRKSMKQRQTVPHRYALLRGHEVFGEVLRHLSDADYKQFSKDLMPVFGDCYAAVPHLSLARIVAMYDAGVLELLATVDNARFSQSEEGQISVETEDGRRTFQAVIDARGQSAEPLSKLPFPSLAACFPVDSTPVLEPFRLDIGASGCAQIYCLALPQILERYPFSQGLANCDKLAKDVVSDVADRLAS